MKYLNYWRKEDDLRTKILEDIKGFIRANGDALIPSINIEISSQPYILVEQILPWGVLASNSSGHNYTTLSTDILINILKGLELKYHSRSSQHGQ